MIIEIIRSHANQNVASVRDSFARAVQKDYSLTRLRDNRAERNPQELGESILERIKNTRGAKGHEGTKFNAVHAARDKRHHSLPLRPNSWFKVAG